MVTPHELKELRDATAAILVGHQFNVELLGIGSVSAGCDRTYYVVAASVDVQQFRRSFGLSCCDLHVTLGFNENDMHGVKKDISTIVEL